MIQRCVDATVLWCRGIVVRRWLVVREGLTHYGTALLALNWITALHERWLWRSAHAGEVVPGYGAALVMLGVFVGARPYLRAGVQRMVIAGLPAFGGSFYGSYGMVAEHNERVRAALPGVTLDVWAERVIAVAIVLLGTFLNGYGTPLARRWGLPI